MKKLNNTILKVLVGSRAHGLERENSDYDYKNVCVVSTREILSLGYYYKGTHLSLDVEDSVTYEIGHFLQLAIKCNPTILEIFKAPVIYKEQYTSLDWYIELRNLFPYVWNPNDVFKAFTGYGYNQRKKMLNDKLDRWVKYGVAYLRTIWNLIDLLKTGDFSLNIKDESFKKELIEVREGLWTTGQIIDKANVLVSVAEKELKKCKHEPNINKVNEFLLKIRREFW